MEVFISGASGFVGTAATDHDFNLYLSLLAINGLQICVGIP